MELNKCRSINDRCQRGERLTLEETIFSFARDDLRLTDVVVSCLKSPWMQDTAMQPGFGAWHKKCHRSVLAAKSRSLRVLLKQHESLDVSLIFAGAFDASQVDLFFTGIYNGKDGVKLLGLDDFLPESKVKLEVTPEGDTVVQSKQLIGPKRKLKESDVESIDDSPINYYESESFGLNRRPLRRTTSPAI